MLTQSKTAVRTIEGVGSTTANECCTRIGPYSVIRLVSQSVPNA